VASWHRRDVGPLNAPSRRSSAHDRRHVSASKRGPRPEFPNGLESSFGGRFRARRERAGVGPDGSIPKASGSVRGFRTSWSTCFLRHEQPRSAGLRAGNQERGGYINAYTSFEQTVYWVDIPARTSGRHRAPADACSSTLPEPELAKEQRSSGGSSDGQRRPRTVAGKQLFATAFAEHPFRHPVIGYRTFSTA